MANLDHIIPALIWRSNANGTPHLASHHLYFLPLQWHSAEGKTSSHFTSSSLEALSSAIWLQMKKTRFLSAFLHPCRFNNVSRCVTAKLWPVLQSFHLNCFDLIFIWSWNDCSRLVGKTGAAHRGNRSMFQLLPLIRNSSSEDCYGNLHDKVHVSVCLCLCVCSCFVGEKTQKCLYRLTFIFSATKTAGEASKSTAWCQRGRGAASK